MSNDNDMKIGFGDDVDIEYQVEAKDLPLLAIDSLFNSESKDDDVIGAVILDISDSESEDVREHSSPSDMPADPTHAFNALFAVLFISKYAVDSTGAVPLKFFNEILEYPNKDLHVKLHNQTIVYTFCRPRFEDVINYWRNRSHVPDMKFEIHDSAYLSMGSVVSVVRYIFASTTCPHQNGTIKENAVFVGLIPGPKEWCGDSYYLVSIFCYFLCYSNSCCLEKLYGLVYFNLVECTVIDSTYSLYIGTAKRIMEKWVSSGLITDTHLAATRVDAENVLLSEYYTSLGTRIGRGFPFMKANEWNISMAHLNEVHNSLEVFCRECEVLYQTPFRSPKMHLHLRLQESILSFGLVYRSWLFGLERCNGFSKDYMTNRRDGLETMYMKKCLEDTYQEDFIQQTLLVIQSGHSAIILELTTSTAAAILSHINAVLGSHEIKFVIIKGNEPILPSTLPLVLKGEIFMKVSEYEHLSSIITRYMMIKRLFTVVRLVAPIILSTVGYTNLNQSIFSAKYTGAKQEISQIQYLFVNLFVDHLSLNEFACLRWYKEIVLQPRAGEGVEVNEVGFKDDSMNSILQVHRICYPVAVGEHLGLEGKAQMCVVPLLGKIYF
ncbi:hypothetical protein PHYBLDRAFT_143538 [Phycomyces blakesleeanus NRRL 1555(-)]|uniref:Uncharacterized protein n=1 Tax=Phycomyces blakesleeanus (strain ATCC 8743b / DSM 1359 / FGSC 10004 / NBRC 33097 / NRRL 1555) TaxID=763407 RepID=A0A162UCT1_PHYB8|nr:hypothetical protein PHYBLDRAFT_143538 [Phycomyces blakesleeanus NRRL 1555(-)]OAD75282.1 hypothetical protein PHYBLDRAFT_143538 [Phycomyces blakesleeanus NRRL 1555(-)]|eukprot:XP_018293322.1 hypothetical protein PHYBLDRAFT_143538 [Phycomyces blakesleeanus NRRL 1555(-)]